MYISVKRMYAYVITLNVHIADHNAGGSSTTDRDPTDAGGVDVPTSSGLVDE